MGITTNFDLTEAVKLLKVGGDLFLRTGLLMAFMLLATRVANQIGEDAGAAHQAIRQIWIFAALVLEAFATTAQSLVGYFAGSDRTTDARRVAALSTWWSFGTGLALAAGLLLLTEPITDLLVPDSAEDAFRPAWIIAALFQPLNSLAFITDGIHWGTSDYRYLRNAMFAASLTGAIGLLLIDTSASGAFNTVWIVSGIWITVRAVFGMGRVWPGIGDSPAATARNNDRRTVNRRVTEVVQNQQPITNHQ